MKTPSPMDPGTRPYVVGAGEGIDTPLGSLACIQVVSAAVTEGRLGIVEHVLKPGHLAAPVHRHAREDELSIVLRGKIGALLGEDHVVAGPGSYVYKPREQWHTFWNAGDEDLHFVELIFPGGFEGFFAELSSKMRNGGLDPAALEPLAKAYQIEFRFDSLPWLHERFGVRFALEA